MDCKGLREYRLGTTIRFGGWACGCTRFGLDTDKHVEGALDWAGMLVSNTLHANLKGNHTSRPKLSDEYHAEGNRRFARDYWRLPIPWAQPGTSERDCVRDHAAHAIDRSPRFLRHALAARLTRDNGRGALLFLFLSGVAWPGKSDTSGGAVAESNVGLSGDDTLADRLYSLSALPHDVRAIVVSGAADAVRCCGYLADVGGIPKAAGAKNTKGGGARGTR